MGQRISYYRNNFDKGLKELLVDNYSKFRQWYLDSERSSMEEFNEPFGSEDLKIYFKKETKFIVDFSNLDKKLIDELSSEFIGYYCDSTGSDGKTLEFFGPSMNQWRYDQSTEMVLATKDHDLIRLWNYIIKGRSLKDNDDFDSYSNDYKIGFLSRQEYLMLKNRIEYHFGDIESMRKKYWTSSEKVQFERVIENSKNGSYSLTLHNPKNSGAEYVLEAINKLTDKNKELITGIE